MPSILAAQCRFPPFTVPQQQVRDAVARLFAGRLAELPRLLGMFDHARIASRDLMRPIEWYLQPAPAAERNRIYQQEGGALLVEAARGCLEAAGVAAETIDQVIFVSSTGLATPTLDVRLCNELGLPSTVSRLPLWGLGCAAGAAGLAQARDYCLAYPRARVLVTALECCSLTLLADDSSRKNLLATALFSDGAAAVLVAGDQSGHAGVQLLASRSHLFPRTEAVMGWVFRDQGMELLLSPRLPALVKAEAAALIDGFLAEQGLLRSELPHYLFHPGGAKILDACREALGLPQAALELSEGVLRRHGNSSSVSVLAVLQDWLARADHPQGPALLATFGPGFAAELLLLRS
jgi:alkylresorcinol/alkylpyrone synthase